MSDSQSSPDIRAPRPGTKPLAVVRRNRSRFWLIVIVALVILAILAIAASRPYWHPIIVRYLPGDRSSSAESSDSGSETASTPASPATPDAVTTPPAGDHSAKTADAQTSPEHSEPDHTKSEIQNAPAGGTADSSSNGSPQNLADDQRRLAVTVGEVAGRLDKLEATVQRMSNQAHTDQILVLAAAQLQDALSRSAPFEPVLAVFRAIAGKDQQLGPELEMLNPYAHDGVRSRIRLEQELRMLEPVLDQPLTETHTSWWQQTIDRAKRMVSVHRVSNPAHPETEPPSADRSLALAEADLSRDDLPGAIDEMKALQGDAAIHAGAWLKHAEARWDSEQAAARIETILTQRLNASGDVSP